MRPGHRSEEPVSLFISSSHHRSAAKYRTVGLLARRRCLGSSWAIFRMENVLAQRKPIMCPSPGFTLSWEPCPITRPPHPSHSPTTCFLLQGALQLIGRPCRGRPSFSCEYSQASPSREHHEGLAEGCVQGWLRAQSSEWVFDLMVGIPRPSPMPTSASAGVKAGDIMAGSGATEI